MNKIKFLFLLITGMIFYSSCSTTDVPVEDEITVNKEVSNYENKELTAYQVKLETLNAQLFTSPNETRGFRSFFKKFLAIVISDAIGAVAGGSIGGAAGAATGAILASATAAFIPADRIEIVTRSEDNPDEDRHGMNDPEFALSHTLIPPNPNKPSNPTIEDSIGYYHNVVLLGLNHTLPSKTVDLDTLIVRVAGLTYNSYHTTQKDVIDNLRSNQQYYEKLTRKIMPYIELDDNLSKIILRFKLQYPELVDQLSVIETFLSGLMNIDYVENNGEYLNQALDLLENTQMDSTIKQDVRNSLIVANSSYQLWEASED